MSLFTPLAPFYSLSPCFSLFPLIKCFFPRVCWDVMLDCLAVAFLLNVVSIALLSQITGQRLEWQQRLSAPCTTHTFPNDAHWKGDFLPVLNNKPAWHIKLSWNEYRKIEPLWPGFHVWGLMRKQSCLILLVLFSSFISGLVNELKGFCCGKTYFC